MNILLDGHFLDKKKEGSRTFIYSYLEGLAKIGDKDADLLNSFSFVVPVFQPEYWQNYFTNLSNVQFIKTFRNAFLRNIIDFPRKVSSLQIDLLQSIYYLPFFSPLGLKKILIIHDVLPFSHPQYFPTAFRCKFINLVKFSFHKADFIVCGSNYSREAIQNYLKVKPEMIRVIPYGINVDRFAKNPNSAAIEYFNNHIPSGPFILVVGRLDPRKGLKLILNLFQKLRLELDIKLVLVGASDSLPMGEMLAINSLQKAGCLYLFQNISDDLLTLLYRQARLLLFLPSVEGFGLPVLEAMAAGIPYLTIPRGGLKEIAITEAWVDAQSPEQMYQKAVQLLHDEKNRELFIKKGHEQIQKFRCQDMVRQYLHLYQEC